MKHHKNFRFNGAVQGIFFRQFVKDLADKLGLVGIIRNEPDGSVYAEVEGEEEDINKLLGAAKKGPAKIENITVTTSDLKNFPDFRIEY
ncbi:MAG TPA: acylphosphatase [Candidatus Paceibacterota bacterium]|nr:acylphosphatase [Candidatus Paceibacterota bacterium]